MSEEMGHVDRGPLLGSEDTREDRGDTKKLREARGVADRPLSPVPLQHPSEAVATAGMDIPVYDAGEEGERLSCWGGERVALCVASCVVPPGLASGLLELGPSGPPDANPCAASVLPFGDSQAIGLGWGG